MKKKTYKNIIFEAMLYNEHLSENQKLCKGTWKAFWKDAEKKKIIVFGVGRASRELTENFLRGREIAYFLDNDKKKQGTDINGIPVKSPSELTEDIYMQSIVLITSTAYMDEIAEQLNQIGVTNYYGILAMEANLLKNKIFVGIVNLMLYCLLPINRKKVVFFNIPDRYYCNLKYVAQALHTKYPKYKLVWVTNNSDKGYPDYVKCVPNTKMGLLYHVATAKVWVFANVQHRGIKKRKGQYFVNTWHGCVALKKIGIYTNANSIKNYSDVVKTSEKTDLFISNSTWCSEMYRQSFKYHGRVLEVGTPRLDILYNKNVEIADKLRDKFGISSNSKVVLYAPTFRSKDVINSSGISMFMLNFELMREKLRAFYNQEVYILLRLHPAISNMGQKLKVDKGIINVTDYNDVYEIMLISDILITDYSSLMFEASFVGQQVFLYANDIEQYVKDRGHYFDYYSLPYPIATTEDELLANMMTINYAEVETKINKFLTEQLELKESGNASEAVADAIDTMINKGVKTVGTMV